MDPIPPANSDNELFSDKARTISHHPSTPELSRLARVVVVRPNLQRSTKLLRPLVFLRRSGSLLTAKDYIKRINHSHPIVLFQVYINIYIGACALITQSHRKPSSEPH